jgi:hypothetical protein
LRNIMKGLLIILASSFFLISPVNMAGAESWVFKKPSGNYTDSKLFSEGKSLNLIKFSSSENSPKKDSMPTEVRVPYIYGAGNSDVKIEKNTQKQMVVATEGSADRGYINVPFNPSIDKIPVPFLGHDIERVYRAFLERERAEQKEEFESTEQYEHRLKTQSKKPLFGSVGKDAILAFVVSPISAYDADSQALSISIPISEVWKTLGMDDSKLALDIRRGKTTKQKSIGQNAYGTKVEIEETYAKSFELAIHNRHSFEIKKVLSEYDKEHARLRPKHNLPATSLDLDIRRLAAFEKQIDMSPTESKAAKSKIEALILAKPTPPYISYGCIRHEATFESPFYFLGRMYYVDVDLLEIWIYDKLSGEIIVKIKGKESSHLCNREILGKKTPSGKSCREL